MTNFVPPLNQPTIDIGNNTTTINGSINTPPTELGNLSIGQQVNVQINPQSIVQIGNKLLLNIDFSLPDMNGEPQIITTSAEIPSSIKLPTQPAEMQIRVNTHNPQKLEFRIINIDGKPVSSLLNSTSDIKSSLQTSTNIPTNVTSSSLNVQKHPLLPLRIQPLLEQSIKLPQISQPQISEFLQNWQNVQMKTEIVQVLQSSYSNNSIVPQTSFAELAPDISNKINSIIKNILPKTNSVVSNNEQVLAPTIQLTEPVRVSIEQTLQQLVGKEFPAQVSNKGELKVLQTPLGEIIPELPLKLEVGEQLIIKISELIFPKENSKNILQESPSMGNQILEIIKPLQRQIKPEIYALLIEKIPADNAKMLSNIISFLKAAGNENITEWLGSEITDNLRLSGAKGQEALTQLENLILGRKEENSQWRIIEVPFYGGESLSKILVAIRKYTDKENNSRSSSRKPDVSRFVIDTSFTALGAFQFDGFAIAKDKRFDLIIRTERDISDDFCSHIMQLFRSSLSAVDYAGNIRINIKEKFIKLCEDNNDTTVLPNGLYI